MNRWKLNLVYWLVLISALCPLTSAYAAKPAKIPASRLTGTMNAQGNIITNAGDVVATDGSSLTNNAAAIASVSDQVALVPITEGGKTGFILVGADDAKHVTGIHAVDFSADYKTGYGAIGDYSFAAGRGAKSAGESSFAMGFGAIAAHDYGFAFGDRASASQDAVAMGNLAEAGTGGVALGSGANAFSYSYALGQNATASGENSYAIGQDATTSATFDDAIAIGPGATAAAERAIVIGGGASNDVYNTTLITGGFGSSDSIMDHGQKVVTIWGKYGIYLDNAPTTVELATGPGHALNETAANALYVRPQVDAEYLTLDREIESWDDIGLTYSNAVRLNSPVTITNDSTWTGWTTTGTLNGGVIWLDPDEYIESAVQTNGIAVVEIEYASDMGATKPLTGIYVGDSLVQNNPPYHAGDGKLRITANVIMSAPGATLGMSVSSVTITAYDDVVEAASEKSVAHLDIIDDPVEDPDAVNKRYVDTQDAADQTYTDSELTAYANDSSKTVRGAQLRLNKSWKATAYGSGHYVLSAGEIAGDGQLIGNTNYFAISQNDRELMIFDSDASGLFISDYDITLTSSNATVMLLVATNGVNSAPYAEWCTDLVPGEWSSPASYSSNSYPTAVGTNYVIEFTVNAPDTGFFRAMQADGDAVISVEADVFDFGEAYFILRDSTDNRWKVTVSTNGVLTTTDLDP